MNSNLPNLKEILKFTKKLLKQNNKKYYTYIINKI